MTTKESGVGEGSRSRFGGAAAVRSLGDAFQPNLAMGRGSYKVPIELPAGPGGLAPQLELQYDTAAGNGPFGLGWSLSLPFVDRKRASAFRAEARPSTAGRRDATGRHFDAGDWCLTSASSCSACLRRQPVDQPHADARRAGFGSSAASRIEATIRWRCPRATLAAGSHGISRWPRDRLRIPGRTARSVTSETIRWSVFRLEFEYEDRPDPWSQFDAGFERTARRCRRIELHHARLAPNTLIRSIDFAYDSARFTGTCRCARFQLTGWRHDGVDWQPAAMPPLELGYTDFSPEAHIRRFRSASRRRPSCRTTTLVDLAGTAPPGIFPPRRQRRHLWENRGDLRFGPPQPLRQLPAGIALSDGGVRFADMEGRGNADLVVGWRGGGYYPNVPQQASRASVRWRWRPASTSPRMAPSGRPRRRSRCRPADLRNGEPLAFFNKGGIRWEGPSVLASSNLPKFVGLTAGCGWPT